MSAGVARAGENGDVAITVIVPTKDEAVHVGRCVDSARALGRVVVVDSGSTDATRDIARAHGAEVVEHPWEGYAAQKNWALGNVGLATPWVLFLDADEYLTPECVAAIREAVRKDGPAGYYLPRRYIFLGRQLKHAWWYPDYQLRLFRVGRGRFEDRLVHEHPIVDGPVEALPTAIVHENLKVLSAFIDRHNRYSDLEAAEMVSPSSGRKPGSFTGSWADRRRALKERVWFRLPFRPFARFFWLYVVRRGFLDGRRGLLFCLLMAVQEFLINAKVAERKLTGASDGGRLGRAARP